MCFTSGPISFVLKVDRSGYVPGEKILINAECDNKSTRNVDQTKASIKQVNKQQIIVINNA